MKLGIVDLPNVGKSTLFNSLTKAGAESANYPFCTIDPNVGVVAVPDERLKLLGDFYQSKKVTPAVIEFVDIAGLVKGASKGEGLGNQFLANIREVDAIVHVVRCFDDTNVIHVDGSVDPLRDIETINLELIFSDLEILERRIAKTTKVARNDKEAAKELELVDYLNRSIFALSSGEKQQIAIGSVYALAPKVYIFDEPSANLDYAATKRLAEIMGKLKHAGYTIFVVEHRFYYLRDLIDRVFLIQEGKIEREFTREEFCSLPEETRISYGLRTAYPERDAEHYQEKPRPRSGTHLMEVHNLGFSYNKGPDVFQNVSFEAHAGDVIGILGHNGAGKTTLLSILTGLLKQRRGEVSLDGKKLTPRQRRSLSYLVMQDTDYQLFASSVEEELSLGIKEDCKEKVDATLEALELSEYRERHPASLSGGQKQRVTIGAAIVKDSPVIYFDEPTSGLDYDSMVRVSNLIEQLSNSGVIVFVVSHDFEFIVRTCTEVVQLDDHGAIQNHRLSPEILKTLSEKYFT